MAGRRYPVFFTEKVRLIPVMCLRSTDVVVACDFNAQLGYLAEVERHRKGRFFVTANRTDKNDRLSQLCPDRTLFLADINFCHQRRHRLTWHPPVLQRRTLIDHIAISHRYRGLIEDTRSFWSTSVNSGML